MFTVSSVQNVMYLLAATHCHMILQKKKSDSEFDFINAENSCTAYAGYTLKYC